MICVIFTFHEFVFVFVKDLDIVDANLPLLIGQFLFAIAPVFVTIILICYSTPIFAAVFVPLSVLYIVLQVGFVYTSQMSKPGMSWSKTPYMHTYIQGQVDQSRISDLFGYLEYCTLASCNTSGNKRNVILLTERLEPHSLYTTYV